MQDIYRFLEDFKIKYERFDHPAVFTFEQANRLVPDLQAARTKNVFVRDKKGGNHFMIMVGDGRRIDLAALSHQLGVKRLGLASPERLLQLLGVDPGSVSPLALINDEENRITLLLDKGLANESYFQCHPLVNTSTLLMAKAELLQFLDAAGHPPRWINIPFLAD
ncbi:MAG: prolyl-tRNA synthetase associated domain-containing protein [Anaerolineales bacterium]|nr:prolyl-tRNA synthetase associated domain-containing protein [Anaerolineales bacterium]